MTALKIVNAALAFMLELGMLASFGYWGYKMGNALVAKWLLAICLPVLAAILWGLILAPKAPYRLDANFRVIVELSLFLLAAFAFYKLDYTMLAVVFAVLSIVCQFLFLVVGEWKP